MALYNPAVRGEAYGSGPQSILPAPISSSYCVPNGTQLTVSCQLTLKSGDVYTINDSQQGQQLFDATKGSGKHAWLRRQRVLRDPSGNTLAYLKPKTWTAHGQWDVYRDEEASDSSLLFTVRTTSCGILSAFSFQIFLANNESKSPDFIIIGKGFSKGKYTIQCRGSPVAEASEKTDTYNVTVNPGVDLAFISSVIVIIDQVTKEVARAAGGVGDVVGGVGDVVGGVAGAV